MQHFHELAVLIEHSPDHDWLDRAACSSLDVDQLSMFFVDAGKAISKEALQLCGRCPVRRDCLDHAYRYDVISGYFGGMSPSKRKVLTRDQALAELDNE